jgi:phosphoribosylformylglycinamidine synthase
MKARVTISLKTGVLDPQGKAIHHALEGLGFSGIRDVRAGKVIELDLDEGVATPRSRTCADACSPTR